MNRNLIAVAWLGLLLYNTDSNMEAAKPDLLYVETASSTHIAKAGMTEREWWADMKSRDGARGYMVVGEQDETAKAALKRVADSRGWGYMETASWSTLSPGVYQVVSRGGAIYKDKPVTVTAARCLNPNCGCNPCRCNPCDCGAVLNSITRGGPWPVGTTITQPNSNVSFTAGPVYRAAPSYLPMPVYGSSSCPTGNCPTGGCP